MRFFEVFPYNPAEARYLLDEFGNVLETDTGEPLSTLSGGEGDRGFLIYPGANPEASHRWLIVGFPPEIRTYGNTLLTTSKIVNARPGRFDSSDTLRPGTDRRGRKIRWEE